MPKTANTPDEDLESQSGKAQEPETPEAGEEGSSPKEEDGLWAGIDEDHPVRKEVKKLREEAAAKRTLAKQEEQEKQELQAKLADAKTSEEVQELIAEHEQKVASLNLELTRERVAHSYKLPDELAEVLKGDTQEELEAHAEKLAKYASTPQPPSGEPRGGKTPAQQASNKEDLKAAVRKHWY